MVKKAGTSIATVFRVISQNGGYPKETEERVRKTIGECGSTPNVNAISLRISCNNNIGVIVSDITNEFFTEIIWGLDTLLLSRRYPLLVCNSNGDYMLENMHIKRLAEKRVGGIIYTSGQNETKEVSEAKNLPIAYIDRVPKNAEVLILPDNETGGYLVGRKPIAKECVKVLSLRDVRYASTIRSRKEEFIRAPGENGISFSEELEMSCFPEYEEIRGVVERLLQKKGCFFGGTFTTNGMMAPVCIDVLVKNRIKVSDQVRVVGFDNISLPQFANPQITTIAQDTKGLALHADEIILKMIEGKEIREKKTIMPVRLIVRGTT